ncbi:MAG: gliding motility lipoprotein GldD [Bacteroidia bacterium]|nr:gliding motility lipoprotein GldD [Bacteroidia bacterium]
MLQEYKILTICILLLCSCEERFIPKPRGYFRIDLPAKEYQIFDGNCPYKFEYPKYSKVCPYKGQQKSYCWLDIVFPAFKAELNISYFTLNDTNLSYYIQDSQKFAMKHNLKADAINEELFINSERKVYGTWYEIKGNTASSLQFYLTDSTKNFFRAALYFNVHPNKDSLAPVVEFIKSDLIHLIESFEWKE